MKNQERQDKERGGSHQEGASNVLPKYFAKTLAGMERLLKDELIELGASDLSVLRRGIEFGADMPTLFRICLCSRFAIRVLRPVLWFEADNTDALYEEAKKWEWGSVMDPSATFAVDVTVHSEYFTHSQFATLRLKDAIVDHFRTASGIRPNVDRENPDVRIHLHISERQVTISLDASGRPLARRGYRSTGAKAPLSEVLAAGLLAKAGWKPGIPLYDPMCGSGTFTVEAALWADGYPIQWHRRKFAFMDWRGFDEEVWWDVRDDLKAERQLKESIIYTSDKDFGAVSQTRAALSNMELDGRAELGRSDFFKLVPRTESGIVVINPPYGERLQVEDLDAMYASIGDRLKTYWPGFTAWIISSDFEALKRVGLKHSSRETMYNGPLECRWVGFELYEGSQEKKANASGSEESSLT
jgi:putative N6-adenine-specific DNA methylase